MVETARPQTVFSCILILNDWTAITACDYFRNVGEVMGVMNSFGDDTPHLSYGHLITSPVVIVTVGNREKTNILSK
jgi:hypothetical protein